MTTPVTSILFISAFLAIGHHPATALHIRTNKDEVVPTSTKDVQIMCQEDDMSKRTQFQNIVLTMSTENATTVPVASINESKPYKAVSHIDDVSVYGYLGKKRASFLLVVWREATFYTAGKYQCTAHKKSKDGELHEIKSSEQVITQNLDKFCSKFNISDWHSFLGPINGNRTKNVKSLLHKLGQLIQNQTQSIEERIDNLFDRLNGTLSKLLKGKRRRGRDIDQPLQVSMREWPKGKYSLLQPDDGCPTALSFTWEQGYHKHHTQSAYGYENKDSVSRKNNFPTPVMVKIGHNNYFYARYCSKRNDTDGPVWPKGHYCINRADHKCPSKFKEGYLTISDEGKDNEVYPAGGADRSADKVYYCCRGDGAAVRPVALPKSKPFFLYRYGGKCQTVRGLKVRLQWFYLDTKDVPSVDQDQNNPHPDGDSTSGVKIFVCYYRPKGYKKGAR